MPVRSGSRGTHAGAHRAPRSGPPARGSVAKAARSGDGIAGVLAVVRSRPVLARTSAVIVAIAVIGVGLIRPGVPSAEPTVYRFLLAWQSRQYMQAAELTTGPPAEVAKQLSGAYKALDATELALSMHRISQHGKTGQAQFMASVGLGSTGLTWTYPGTFSLRDGSDGWRVVWSPSVIVPQMKSGERLAVVTSVPPRQPILDSAGNSLAVSSPAYQVGVYPSRLRNADRTAEGLSKITRIPADQIEGQIGTAPSAGFFELMTLSPSIANEERSELAAIPGVVVRPEQVKLFDSIAPDVVGTVGTETASILREDGAAYRPGITVGESGLQQAFQRQLTGTPQTEVVLLNRAGQPQDVLKTWPWTRGQPLHTTLDSNIQLAADQAVGQLPDSAAVVAVQASTGRILAVASHSVSGQPSIDPLAGSYQPGQAFTIVSTSAILNNHRVAPNSPVLCTQSNPVNGHNFVNNPPEQFLARSTTFRKDFAFACATAFVGLSEPLKPADLTKAANAFGIGGWQLPIASYAGTIGQPYGEGVVAADTIGTGDVRVSPLGMALAAGVADSGKWHPPSLVTGADPSSASRAVETPQVLSMLRSLMRNAVSAGAGKAANISGKAASSGGKVYGQVGNAAFSQGHDLRISWFVGYRGDIAFAVVELGNSASDSAAPLAGTFLHYIHTGS